MQIKDQFSSRWGIIFAGLGMAIGTGNIWRFPRVVSQNGGGAFMIAWLFFLFFWSIPLLIIEMSIGRNGGAFMIAWLFFLFFWSIPLLIIEMSIGRKTRLGVIGSFGTVMGKKFTWMGTFVAFVPTAITFYYTVVTGWCLKYFFATSFQGLIKKDSLQFWRGFTSSWEPVIFHFAAITIGCFIIYSGVVKGIERWNKFFIPSLFILLIIGCLRVLTLPGAFKGMNFLFSPNFPMLLNYKIWLNALSQSAWSTGAGWGLMLTYSIYSRKEENPIITSSTIGFGNCVASLLLLY